MTRIILRKKKGNIYHSRIKRMLYTQYVYLYTILSTRQDAMMNYIILLIESLPLFFQNSPSLLSSVSIIDRRFLSLLSTANTKY